MVCLNSLIKVSLAVSMSLFYFYLQLDLFKQRPDSFLRLAKVNLDVNKCYTGDWRVLGCIFLINVFFYSWSTPVLFTLIILYHKYDPWPWFKNPFTHEKKNTRKNYVLYKFKQAMYL